ncbi:hypothetical protein LTR17_023306 [Elasticomyces elasticus]|nr:hypothetical protein LTR17_023306 [Elasticomyces elasticus]
MGTGQRPLGMPDYYAILGIEPGASKTCAARAYYALRHEFLDMGYKKDGATMRALYEAKDALTDDEERGYYEEEYFITVSGRTDDGQTGQDGIDATADDESSDRSEVETEDGDLSYEAESSVAPRLETELYYEDDCQESGSDASGTDEDSVAVDVDAQTEADSIDYVRYRYPGSMSRMFS